MRRSNRLPYGLLPTTLCLLFYLPVFSQNITYQNPTSFFSCDDASFAITVQNTTGASLTGVSVTVNFTTTNNTNCGISYVQGSVTGGAMEGNISNLSSPQFLLPNLTAGASLTLNLLANADCQTAACIDNAEVFVNNITLNWSGGSTSVTTNPYVVDRALLIITAVNNTVMTGIRGSILQRKVTVRNTRPAALSGFTFKDVFQPGIDITSPQGTVVPAGPGTFRITLDASDFSAIGDGDGLFEFNETMVIVENIEIISCGIDEQSSVSNISVAWGCENSVCQQENVTAVVTIQPYLNAPVLIWEPILNAPECFCGPNGIPQGMKITNAGNGKALEIRLLVRPSFGYLAGMLDTNSLDVDSLNMDIEFQKTFGGLTSFSPPCDGPNSLATDFEVIIASLDPGASVVVSWDYYYCHLECVQPSAGYEYTYSYYKECPPSIFVQNGQYITVGEVGKKLSVLTAVDGDGPMMDEGIYTVDYQVVYDDSLSLLDGELTVEVSVPCGMEWLPTNPMLLNGEAPISLNVIDSGTETLVTAVYDLPLAVDTGSMQFSFRWDCEAICTDVPLCNIIYETTCVAADTCGADCETAYFGNIITTVNKCGNYPLDCNVQSCTDFGKSFECPIDTFIIDAPPGYLRYTHTAMRKNYGLPDSNNDRFADAPSGLPDMNLVARRRFIAGDIVESIIKGEVVIDKPGATLQLGAIVVSIFGGNQMSASNRQALLTPQNFPETYNLLRVYDKSQNLWYECNDIPVITSLSIRYTYDLTTVMGPCLPANFAFDQGDSIIFTSNFRIGYNIQTETDGTPWSGNLVVEPTVWLFDSDTTNYTKLDCDCSLQELQLTHYDFAVVNQGFGLRPCEPTPYANGVFLRLLLAEGNYFPYEYRNHLFLDDYRLTLPPTVQICSTQLTNLRLTEGPDLFSGVELVPQLVNGEYYHDLAPFQIPPLDDAFSAQFKFVFKNECTNKFSMPLTQELTMHFAPTLPEDDPVEYSLTANTLRPLIANLNVVAPLFDLVSFSNQFLFDFNLKNTPTIVSNISSGPAPNAWAYVSSQTGLVDNFQLIDMATGQAVPAINGIWQLGDLPENLSGFPYRLIGTNNSCEKENLQLHYGWNCGSQYQNIVQTPCYEQVQELTIESPPGEIDMQVESPNGCAQLCDTIDYHTVEVFNAQLGSVYNLRVQALVPPGFSAVTGSCEVEYPTGSGIYYPIGDPTLVGTGVLEWNLSNLFDSLAAGLPGVGEAPFNSLTLRFFGETTCDFIADAYLLFVAVAEQNCGTPTNSIAKPADPLCIDGVSSAFSMNINAVPTPGFGCNDEVNYEVSLSATDTLPPGACLIVTLPPGITYQLNSCENLCSTNLNCSPTIDGSLVTWQLPAGVLPNQLICFKFNTQGWSGLGCENGVVLFRSAAETQALCALTGDSCSTKVSTGSLILPFDIQRPAFDLTNFEITAVAAGSTDQVNFSVLVTNNGATSQPPLVLQFWLDNDGDGTGDQLVHTENSATSISSGQTGFVTGSFSLPANSNLCQLLAVLDPDAQCACSGDQIQVATPIEYQTGLSWTVCSGADQMIGVSPMPGFDYQWTPDDCLLDAQVPMTLFNCVNDGLLPVEYQYTLAEGNGFCEIQNLMSVTVQPVPGLAYADSPICEGDMANMAATDGAFYNWQGPGITNPNQQIQTVSPTTTSQYNLTVTDAFGCTGTDVVSIVVAPLPQLSAGADEAFCPGDEAKLNATFDADWDYFWTPVFINNQSALSDPTIPNPTILSGSDTVYTLMVIDENGCSATDQVAVTFADSLVLTMPVDVTICTGGTASLNVTSNVAANFIWSPDDGICQTPNCASYSVSPTNTTTYTVSGTSSDGCLAGGIVTVTVVNDQIVVNGPTVEICEGETATINGEVVSVPGVYCDTFIVAGGCDSLYCVELLVKPNIDTIQIDSVICPGDSVEFEGGTYADPGTYCASFTAQNGCDSTRCLVLSLFGEPSVELMVSADTVSVGDTVLLSIPEGNYQNVLWYANDSLLAECTGFVTCEHIAIDSSTVYTIEVVNGDGCAAMATQSIIVLQSCDPEKVEVPNVFTPNNDDTNDVFNIVGPGTEVVLNMRIWNRWGQKVYDGTGPWDGKQDGKDAASDVYIYIIEVGCAFAVDDLEKVWKGDVTLLR